MTKPDFKPVDEIGAPCLQCQIGAYRDMYGEFPSEGHMRRYFMWACCCSPAAVAESMAYWSLITN